MSRPIFSGSLASLLQEIEIQLNDTTQTSKEDSDPEHAQRDKDMQNSITLISKYFTKIYKPTNNNLKTSSNSRNKNMDSTPRTENDRYTGQFGNQRKVTFAGAREIVGNQDTDEELDEKELEAHYSFTAKIQEVPHVTDDNSGPTYDTYPFNVIPDHLDMCNNEFKDDHNADDNDEDERDRCKSALHQKEQKHQSHEALKTQAYKTFQFKEKNAALINQGSLENIRYDLLQIEKEQLQKDFKISQDKDIDKIITLENQVKFLNDVVYKTNKFVQTIHMLAPNLSSYYNGRASFVNPMYLKRAQSAKPCLYRVPYDKDDLVNIFARNCDETLILEDESRSKLDKDKVKPYD
ncbi:hypothetical protein Tco_1525530 [Tanacetum coccineum]